MRRLRAPRGNVVQCSNTPQRLRVGDRKPVENLQLFVARRITYDDLHQKPIHLRHRKRVGSFCIQRIHGGHHDERIGKRMGLRADRHLPLLHRFEQCRLHFGRSAIDFVGQHNVCKDRTENRRERAFALVEDSRSDDIARQ